MFKRLGYLTRQVTYNKRCIVDGALIKSKFQNFKKKLKSQFCTLLQENTAEIESFILSSHIDYTLKDDT